jgi:hypothetical protein
MSFPDGHDRLCAIEWLVQRLAVEHCLRTPDPIVAAEHLKAAGEDYGTLVFTRAVKAGTAEGMTGLDISTALALLVQNIPDDVRAALGT